VKESEVVLAGPRLRRRELLVLGAGAFAVAVLPFVGRRRRLVRRSFPAMGTVAEIAVVAEDGDAQRAYAAIDAACAALRDVERRMTRFRDDSEVGRANLGAVRDSVAISPDTAAVLEEALRWAEASDGAFDPCLGRAIELWNVAYRREPPPAEAVRAVAGRGLWRALDLDTRAGRERVRFGNTDVRLDLGGIAKGFGVDRAAAALRERGIERALVNVGGDLYALGASEDGDPWRVGVQRPDDPSRISETLLVADAAIATSGDYLQYFEHAGRRYHHLLDPMTGAPRATPVRSVTIQAATCLAADAAATAVFGMERATADSLLGRRASGARLVTSA
jgi:thiamine biosynthesis lipoprotein